MQEHYEMLILAIIEQAIDDYFQASEKYAKYMKWCEEAKNNPKKLERKSGESYGAYKNRVYRSTPTYWYRKAQVEKEIVESSVKFFCGDWIKELADVDGEMILEQCKRKMNLKEGRKNGSKTYN